MSESNRTINKSSGSKVKSKLVNAIKKIDVFGNPIALNYQGSSIYKSMLGGITTILFRFSVVGYFIS